MDEEAIIRERITVSEANYKRLLKICMTLISETPSDKEAITSSRTLMKTELESFEAMLSQLQLQLDMNEKEISKYEEQKREGNIHVQELTEKSAHLQQELATAQVIRAQKEECSAMVDNMVKAKKVMLDDGRRKVPIIALLNSSRADDEKLNESLIEEISELEAQKAKYQSLWDDRRAGFDEFSAYVDEFKTDILKRAKGGVDREGDTRDATPFEDEREEGEEDEHNSDTKSGAVTPGDGAEERVDEPEDIEMANA